MDITWRPRSIGGARPSVHRPRLRRPPVGVAISADAVRAVMPRRRGGALVGSVPLPPGAVVHGEIIEPEVVQHALSELWAAAKFPTKSIVIGLNNQDVVTRVVEMPALEPKDLRSALSFEIVDLLPFSIDEAIIDHRIIERFESEDGAPQLRVLVVVAVRQSVERITSVLESAGLSVGHIDVTAMALTRAVVSSGDDVHAVVDVGRDTLTLAIHQGGEVHFCRSLVMQEAEEEQWAEFQAELRRIEVYRQRGEETQEGDLLTNAFTSGDRTIEGIVGSLEYYALQPGSRPVAHLSLVGDATMNWTIAPRLADRLRIRVDLPDPVQARSGDVDPAGDMTSFVAAYGLALPPTATPLNPGRRLDLRPLKKVERGTRSLLARAGAATALTALILAGLTPLVAPDVNATQEGLESSQARLAAEQHALRSLQGAAEASRKLQVLRRQVAEVDAMRIDWARLFQEVRTTAPSGTTITAMLASGPTKDPKIGELPGQIQITARAPNQTAIASWLGALGAVAGFRRPWLSTASSTGPGGPGGGEAGLTNFTITVELTDQASTAGSGR